MGTHTNTELLLGIHNEVKTFYIYLDLKIFFKIISCSFILYLNVSDVITEYYWSWYHSLEGEAVAGGVKDPGIILGTLHAGVQTVSLPGQLPGAQGAGVGQGAEGLALHQTLLFPLLEVPQSLGTGGVLHPLNHLRARMVSYTLDGWDPGFIFTWTSVTK